MVELESEVPHCISKPDGSKAGGTSFFKKLGGSAKAFSSSAKAFSESFKRKGRRGSLPANMLRSRRGSNYDVMLDDGEVMICPAEEILSDTQRAQYELEKQSCSVGVDPFEPIRSSSLEVSIDDIELEYMIGEGATGIVYKATFHGKDCAAKTMKAGVSPDTQEYKDLVTEMVMLSSIASHPNLVQFFGACIENPEKLIILQERMEGPNLEKFLTGLGSDFLLGRPTVFGWSLDIMRALEHLHNMDPVIMHRDIKPANLMLTKDLNHLKLADFGTSKKIPRTTNNKQPLVRVQSLAGTLRYMAPEMLHRNTLCDERVDIYSAALVIWYLLTGRRPEVDIRFHPEARPDLTPATARWPDLAALTESMWAHQPDARPPARECVERLLALPDRPDLSLGAAPRGGRGGSSELDPTRCGPAMPRRSSLGILGFRCFSLKSVELADDSDRDAPCPE